VKGAAELAVALELDEDPFVQAQLDQIQWLLDAACKGLGRAHGPSLEGGELF
jgi:hypothetical protein